MTRSDFAGKMRAAEFEPDERPGDGRKRHVGESRRSTSMGRRRCSPGSDAVSSKLGLCTLVLLHVLTTASVQVFGRRGHRANNALRQPAAEKRQGTKW